MELMELTKKEFDAFALIHPHCSFQQNSHWAKFKEGEGWHSYFIGLKDKGKLLAATLLLSMDVTKIKKRVFYAPRGFLIDYQDKELVLTFTKQLIVFIRDKQGGLLKIDPYLLYRERDKYGKIVPGGFYRDFVRQYLQQAGFIQVEDLKRNTIQPQWLYMIDLRNETLDSLLEKMDAKTRQTIRRNQRLGFTVRELAIEEFSLFSDMMAQINKKYHTLSATTAFYEDLFHCFGKETIKIMVIELHFTTIIANLKSQLRDVEKQKQATTIHYHQSRMTEEYFVDKQLAYQKELTRIQENIDYFERSSQLYQYDTVVLGGYLYNLWGNEIVALQGGMKDEFLKWDASYLLHYQMLKLAIEKNYQTYNLYEISGDFTNTDPLYGSYLFKRNFGGNVVQLIGEFDYPIDPSNYVLLKQQFPDYLGVKIIYK